MATTWQVDWHRIATIFYYGAIVLAVIVAMNAAFGDWLFDGGLGGVTVLLVIALGRVIAPRGQRYWLFLFAACLNLVLVATGDYLGQATSALYAATGALGFLRSKLP